VNSPLASQLDQSVFSRLAVHVKAGEEVCAGFSGGLDSSVLLDVLHACAPRLGFRLSALHVHHNLSPNADSWASFCEQSCARLGIVLHVTRVKVDAASGLGLEAAARNARYAAYAETGAQWIALAHHADDFAETFLQRLLRGTGIKGLAAVPETRALGAGQRVIRPLLQQHRSVLEQYARERGLAWVEDESNADTALDRNYLRHEIISRLDTRFPAAIDNILRAGQNAAEAQDLLDDLARIDLKGNEENDALPIAVLRALSAPRARNVLRFFLAENGVAMPDSTRLVEALRQIREAAPDTQLIVELGDWQIRRHLDHVVLISAQVGQGTQAFSRPWQGENQLELAELGGKLTFSASRGEGIRARLGKEPGWVVRTRAGGERMRPDARRPTRTLKNLLQEHDVPAWTRDRLPLLFHRDRLVWVPGVGIDCAYQCEPGELGLLPIWAATQ
jgi:tRNA(Ile)-lysidine synthase